MIAWNYLNLKLRNQDNTILKAAQTAFDEGIAFPILLGREDRIKELMEELDFDADVPIIDPKSDDRFLLHWEDQSKKPSPGGAGLIACAFLGFRIRKVPAAVKAAYLPIFLMASFRVILLLSIFFFICVLFY